MPSSILPPPSILYPSWFRSADTCPTLPHFPYPPQNFAASPARQHMLSLQFCSLGGASLTSSRRDGFHWHGQFASPIKRKGSDPWAEVNSDFSIRPSSLPLPISPSLPLAFRPFRHFPSFAFHYITFVRFIPSSAILFLSFLSLHFPSFSFPSFFNFLSFPSCPSF